MAGSLHDQLLNMGLANKTQAKKAKESKRKQAKKKKSGQNVEDNSAAIQAQVEQQRQEKQARDRALNQQREEERLRRAALAEARQLLAQHAQPAPQEGPLDYNFVHNRIIKTLHLDRTQHTQLSRGTLAIALLEKGYGLIADDIAARIEEKDPSLVIRIRPEPEADPDDPYADYQIPDDLMW
ncbi:hypothetical protein GCM10011348_35380 [Marinobacterium nitratireducens]|uniref:Nucleoprotein/polynucleotide-associated enzyme n=1 Tax=Marinobacterium nitratireducens TaxID=518897 RepID=A0A917ZNE7_9GAMM|nr:DUF2058 domain-containing protein [Marinobacterium nitratireducens]GGO85857.1 hypothetical protein GCM10011348_35380 [Marinobacterium nitratireducens]